MLKKYDDFVVTNNLDLLDVIKILNFRCTE